jgi:hypothetical protein
MVAQENLIFQNFVRGKSVAVVGNADSLFQSNYGDFIDSHDIVIRFNKPAIFYKNIDYKKSHGEKIDAWAFVSKRAFENTVLNKEENIEIVKKNFYENDNIIKLYTKRSNSNELGSITILQHYLRLLNFDISCSLPKSDNTISLSERRKRLRGAYKYDFTTGLVVLYWLYASAPSKVSIFGFDFKKTATFSEKEKYETDIINRIDIRCNHNYNVEEEYINKILLKRRRNFRIYE